MSDINNLPNELMVETFAHLELNDLLRCMRVNKFFKTVTEHSAFDKMFFRTRFIKSSNPINFDELHVNPALDQLSYMCRCSIEDAVFLLKDHGELALIESIAAKQNATEPAVTRIIVRPYGDPNQEGRTESGQGVTVQDVMEGLCGYYEQGTPYYDECHYNFEGFYKTKNDTEDELVLEIFWGS
ncbi:hypothetical protein QM012_007070 [Aureobasidium pullulans]|uniref:F-box domain-containing protein n=1 Tax=Aureobasidium pullulans TaxID=5580 RepID=A0ABR0TLV8_AURPU